MTEFFPPLDSFLQTKDLVHSIFMGMKWERQSAEAWPAYGSGTQVNAIGHFVVLDICGMPEPLLNE